MAWEEFDEERVDEYIKSDESWRYSLEIANYFSNRDVKQAAYWYVKAYTEGDPFAQAFLWTEGFSVDKMSPRWVRRIALHFTRRRSEELRPV